jgi:hypothetical protein
MKFRFRDTCSVEHLASFGLLHDHQAAIHSLNERGVVPYLGNKYLG